MSTLLREYFADESFDAVCQGGCNAQALKDHSSGVNRRPDNSHLKKVPATTRKTVVFGSCVVLSLPRYLKTGEKDKSRVVTDWLQLKPNPKQILDLKAVVVHHGTSSSSGHYTCYRHVGGNVHSTAFSQLLLDAWYHFDDDRCSQVKGTFDDTSMPEVNQNGYLFFYSVKSVK